MNVPKRHIVIVTSEFPPEPGGIGNHAFNLALYLHQRGHRVQVIADQRSRGPKDALHDKDLPFSVHRIALKRFRIFMYFQRIITTFKSVKNANYIIATGKFSLWNVAFCSFFIKRQTMAVIHGSEVNFKNLALRKTINVSLKQFDIIVAVSDYTKKLVSHVKRDVVVIPNGIDIEKWKKTKLLKPYLKGYPVITTVGRVSGRKGQLQVIKCLPELLKTYPELHYHCIGIPAEAESFMTVARALNVSAHITFHGALEHDALLKSLEATDIFVMLSSETHSGDVEGFGIAILEANAIGIPAIGALNCGIEDAIQEGVSGLLIDSSNRDSFRLSVQRILQDKDNYEKGAIHWAKQHDWSHIIKRYDALIK